MSLKILIAGCLRDEKYQIEDVVKEAIGGRQEAGPWNVSLVKLGTSWSIDLDGPEPKLQGISLSATDDSLKETIVGAIGNNGSTGDNGAAVDTAPTANSAPPANTVPAANTAPVRNAVPMRTAAPTRNPVFPKRNAIPSGNAVPTGNNGPAIGNIPLLSLEEMETDEGLLAQTAGAPIEPIARAPIEPEPEPIKSTPGGHECESCGRAFRVIYEAEPQEPKMKAPVACPHCWQMTDVSVPESAAATQEYRAEAIDS